MQDIGYKLAPLAVACAALLGPVGCSWGEAGYSAVRSDQEAWIGHRSADLFDSWGEPDVRETLAAGYHAFTWVGDDGACRRTFTDRDGRITGYSETDCEE